MCLQARNSEVLEKLEFLIWMSYTTHGVVQLEFLHFITCTHTHTFIYLYASA